MSPDVDQISASNQSARVAGVARPPDPRRPAALAVVNLVLFGALAVALTTAGRSNAWDLWLEAAIRYPRDPVLEQAMVIATYLCSWQMIVAGLVLADIYLLVIRQRLSAAALTISVVGDDVIVSTLKPLFGRVRPDQLDALLPDVGPSFPSGHTFAAVAFYGLLALLVARLMPAAWMRRAIVAGAILFVATVGISRVYVGAHWPSDVLGSWLLSTAWVSLVIAGLELARSRWPAASPPQTAPSAGKWALALVIAWLAFAVALWSTQPAARQSESIALLSLQPPLAARRRPGPRLPPGAGASIVDLQDARAAQSSYWSAGGKPCRTGLLIPVRQAA